MEVFVPTIPPVHPRRQRHSYQHPPRILRLKQMEELQQLIVNLPTQTQIHDYYNTMPPPAPVKSIWKFPWLNLLKLNTDGSSKGNPGPSSFGGLIRDNKGRWICGYMGKMIGGTYTALEAEVWSIFKGLCLIKEMDMSFLLIETDCQAAVQLKVKELDNDHPLKPVIDAIKRLMSEQRCTMIHTKRDGNHCADQLAKLGGKQSEECMLLENPPKFLIPYLVRDIEAASEDEFQQY